MNFFRQSPYENEIIITLFIDLNTLNLSYI